MVLDDGLEHRGVPGKPLVRYDVLAGVVTFRGTVPEEQAEVEGYGIH